MDKLLQFPSVTEKGIFCFVVDTEQNHLIKTAAEYHPSIASYIANAKAIPGKTQILLTALGAYEYWHCNVNGDAFLEEDLAHDGDDYGHRTFKTTAKIYKHHVNKDPKAAYGEVVLAVYNPKYHRVELIVVLDNDKAPDIAKKINEGEYPEWSMGCRVKYDVCSICGNKAPTRAQYCDHLRYYMGRIHPGTGKMAYAINPRPVFFDISQVFIGADKIAKTLKKVASANVPGIVKSSAELAEKHATIEKEIPASEAPASTEDVIRAIPEVKARELPLPKDLVNNIAKKHDLSSIFSTMTGMGIVPKPREFQRIILVRSGLPQLADRLDEGNFVFDPDMAEHPTEASDKMFNLSPNNFSGSIMKALEPFMADRSYAAPHLSKRIVIMIKSASVQEYDTDVIKLGADESKYPKIDPKNYDQRKPIPLPLLMGLVAYAYASLAKKSPLSASNVITGAISKHPALAGMLSAAAPMILNHITEPRHVGNSDAETMSKMEPEIINTLSEIDRKKEIPLLKLGFSQGTTSAALALGGLPIAYMASHHLNKHVREQPDYTEGKVKSFIRKYPEIAGIVGSAAGFEMLRDKSLVGKTLNLPFKVKDFVGKLKKTGAAMDTAADMLLWPLVMGPTRLPTRILSNVADQIIFAGSKKLLSNKNNNNKIG